jgi:Ca2+-binding RTX toxin-like protein
MESLEERKLMYSFMAGSELWVVGTSSDDYFSLEVSSPTTVDVYEAGVGTSTYSLASISDICIWLRDGDDYFQVAPSGVGLPPLTAPISGTADEGDDVIFAGSGNDDIDAGDGNDFVSGKGGTDVLSGGLGGDTLQGGDGRDYLRGDEGSDVLRGGNDGDEIHGGTGNDLLQGDAGNDMLFGGTGNDILVGDQGDDTLFAEAGNDTLFGGDGCDGMYGGAGDDVLDAIDPTTSIADLIVDGGAGTDSAMTDSADPVVNVP